MDWISNVLVWLSFLFFLVEGRTAQVVVKTHSGPLRGFKVLAGNLEIAVFRGIPYAQPPTGLRRFKQPEAVSPWDDVYDALDYGPICVQGSMTKNNGSYRGIEDCLTLNVFKPMLFEKEDNNIPVIIMPHTGNFISGSGQDINGVELAKSLEAIVITMNYRLGILGFYSLMGHVKHNLGIRDQIMAMTWVKDNIESFNGNPNNILLIADHVMTHLHLMSPLTRKLFNRAISYDGKSYLTPINDYTFQIKKHRTSLEKFCGKLEETVDIPVEHNTWVCLRKLPLDDLVSLSSELSDNALLHPFRPVYDDEVINLDSHITTSFLHCDYMAFTSHLDISDLDDQLFNDTVCREMFMSLSSHVTKDRFTGNVRLVGDIIKSHYFPPFLNQTYNFCKSIVELLDDLVMSDIISFTNHHSRTGLTFLNFVNIWTPIINTSNGGEKQGDISCILTNLESPTCRLNHTIRAGVNSVVRAFLYHGYPSVKPGIVWRPYTTSSKNYLYTTGTNFRAGDSVNWPAERIERLWLDILPEVTNNDMSDGPAVQVLEQSVTLSWGLTEQELEALVFSLILTCLVLFCVTLTLIRIVCFVNGKTFYKKKKQQPKKDIVLTDTKRRKENDNVLSISEIFRTHESLSLSRRSGDHSDMEA